MPAADSRGIVPRVSDQESTPPALVERLQLIEEQPLDARAEALGQLYEELRAMLESGDSAPGA